MSTEQADGADGYDPVEHIEESGHPKAGTEGFNKEIPQWGTYTWAEKEGTAAEITEGRQRLVTARLVTAATLVAQRAPKALCSLASVPEAKPVQPGCCPSTVRQPRVYIAGPMRGYPACNVAAFFRAQYEWQAVGWAVLNPALVDLERPLITAADIPTEERGGSTANWRELVIRDCELVCKADAIAFLTGSIFSTGAKAERGLADWLCLPIYYQTSDGTWWREEV